MIAAKQPAGRKAGANSHAPLDEQKPTQACKSTQGKEWGREEHNGTDQAGGWLAVLKSESMQIYTRFRADACSNGHKSGLAKGKGTNVSLPLGNKNL